MSRRTGSGSTACRLLSRPYLRTKRTVMANPRRLRVGIDVHGRSKKLYINYRTTDEIRRQALALLEGVEIDDLDGGHDESTRYRTLSHGQIAMP